MIRCTSNYHEWPKVFSGRTGGPQMLTEVFLPHIGFLQSKINTGQLSDSSALMNYSQNPCNCFCISLLDYLKH